ncbi:MAG: glycoside hydrolase family 97 protein [Bacteroidales bacterium]|nr:glycoside hydrolase family 97 protein [Bacteroidales bacterium]
MKAILKSLACVALASICLPVAALPAIKTHTLSSPNGRIKTEIQTGNTVTYSITFDGKAILDPSEISMTLEGGTVFGSGKVSKAITGSKSGKVIPVAAYKKNSVDDVYNSLTLVFKNNSVEFRAYDNAVVYRFVSTAKKGSFNVESEKAEFNFPQDWMSWVPYVNTSKFETFESQFRNSFENYYEHINLSSWNPKRLAFLPVVVDASDGVKVLITESDLRDYPGMFLNGQGGKSLKGVNATYPKVQELDGRGGAVREREDFIAKASAGRSFPWRIVGIFEDEKNLANSDLTWLLGKPADKSMDWSWVKPGKVAWDWWNDWNIYGVDFESGVNNDTYKYYIDFASKHGIEYVILDEGWAVPGKYDLFQVIPEIDIKELVDYGAPRNVGIILWASYPSVIKDIEGIFKYYSAMGVKGFKVDFMDRDDQLIMDFYEDVASTAAKYHLIIDFHGAFKPSGLERTYPNIVNYEGVAGLEQMKWGAARYDQVTYDVIIPFVRMAAGRMDYTQGAMINATKGRAFANNSSPMSQGTRCRQLAEYAIFEAPLTMLCDSPSNYMAEPECTEFIAGFPTAWDETVPVCGKIGEYVAIARRKGNDWYIGALTNWDARDLVLDLGFIGSGKMTVFQDGVNAHRAAKDYKKVTSEIPIDGKVQIHMAPGGGWVAKVSR